jgi:hypothetical protein
MNHLADSPHNPVLNSPSPPHRIRVTIKQDHLIKAVIALVILVIVIGAAYNVGWNNGYKQATNPSGQCPVISNTLNYYPSTCAPTVCPNCGQRAD